MNPSLIEVGATVIFVLAILHTFMVGKIAEIGHHFPEHSMRSHLFHFLAEVEAVFGMWAAIFLGYMAIVSGVGSPIPYLESLNFTEPAFVFVIMAMAGTRPVIKLAEKAIVLVSSIMPMPKKMSIFFTA
jgi:hypothetical protein